MLICSPRIKYVCYSYIIIIYSVVTNFSYVHSEYSIILQRYLFEPAHPIFRFKSRFIQYLIFWYFMLYKYFILYQKTIFSNFCYFWNYWRSVEGMLCDDAKLYFSNENPPPLLYCKLFSGWFSWKLWCN